MNRSWALISSLLLGIHLSAQQPLYYLNEGFEDSSPTRALWTSEPIDNVIKWTYQTGGDHSSPPYAYEGNLNAFFEWYDPSGPTVRTLVSPPLDLSNAKKPQLIFAHAQFPIFSFQDELKLLFRAGTNAPWDTIATYDAATPSNVDYELRFLNIDEYGSKYLCKNFQIGFMGIGLGGNGICIDSVIVVEKDTIPKFINNCDFQVVPHSLAPSGVKDFPVLRVHLNVFGNSGYEVLHSLSFNSLSTNDSDFSSSGFKLFQTSTQIYRNKKNGISTQVAGPVSISNGVVTFSGLQDTLMSGDNYIWLTLGLNDSAKYNDTIDFELQPNSIVLNDTTLPSTATDPPGNQIIKQSVFFDNFSTLKGWTLGGDFQIAPPEGFTINIAKDPDYAYSDSNVLGTDLTMDGAYIAGITTATAYFATTPVMDLKYYKNIELYAQKWLSFNSSDDITIDVSTDGGATWKSIWSRQKDLISFNETTWSELLITKKIDSIARLQPSFQLRFAMNTTSSTYVLGGWNIDDFAITGMHLDKDVGITQMFSPYDDCIGTFNDTVKIMVRNYAEGPTPAKIPVYFSLNGTSGARVYDTIQGPIPQDDSVLFTFSTTADFQYPGNYDFVVGTALAGDQDPTNNTLSTPLFIQNNVTTPYSENFETGGGYWKPSDSSTWLCMIPSGGVPVLTNSPHSWFVAPSSSYLNSDTSWITSSCYDLTSSDIQVIELKYWNESEDSTDGANIQYTVDDGATWHVIDSSAFGTYSGWYNKYVSALGNIGWSGTSGGWKTVRNFLPVSLSSEPRVKFRVYWSTNDSVSSGRGFVFDDFSIYPAPPDIGVSSIVTPYTACPDVNDGSLSAYITNYGVNKLRTGDTIFVGIDLDSSATVHSSAVLTSDLLPGDSVLLNFNANLDLSQAKDYSLKAFTLNESDPTFYDTISNDTAGKTFTIWPSPVITLADTIGTRQPDTLVLRPQFSPNLAGNQYMWQDGSTADTLKVNTDGYYSVKMTEPVHSCSSIDSVLVLLLYYDAGADSIISPVTSCSLTNNELIRIRVRNMGTDSLLTGDPIAVSYSVNGGTPVYDTVVLTNTLYAGHTIFYTFSNHPYDFSAPGNYTITASAHYIGGDKLSSNDTTSRQVKVYGYTPLNLGPDVIISGFSHTLDAGSGFLSYLWNTGDTLQTFTTGTSGTYWVHATDANGCTSADTASVWFKIRDLMAKSLLSPYSSCNDKLSDTVRLQLYNNGTDTIPTNDSIMLSYNVNNGNYVTEKLYPSSPILPGAYYTYEFNTKANLSGSTSYAFNLSAVVPNDLRPNNDTITSTISSNAVPVVDLGVDPNVFYKTTQKVLDAGAGTNYAYLWQDGSTNETYTVTNSTLVKVLVTDTISGCYGGDTVLVNLDILDYTITSVGIAPTTCSGIYNNVTVGILNNGNLARASADLTLTYQLDNSTLFSEEYIENRNWLTGATHTYQTVSPIDLSEIGTRQLKVTVTQAGDLRPENNTYSKTVDVIPSPEINLGGDTINVSLPYTLDAGSGEKSYLWNDNSENSTLTIDNAGKYSVTVTGNNGCVASKNVYVTVGTSISPVAAKQMKVKIFPNPTNDHITIDATFEHPGNYKIEIMNGLGKVMYSKMITGTNNIDRIYVGDLDPGLYFIRISNSEMYHISKLTVQ